MTEKTKTNGAAQEQAVTKSNGGPPACKVGPAGLEVDSMEAMWWLSGRIFTSNLCPTDCKRQEDVFIRMQMGYEIGLSAMQSVQNIATINGRPSLWGPLVKGLVLNSGLCVKWEEKWIGNDDGSFADDFGHQVTVRRKGFEHDFVVAFTVRDAKKAGLWGKNVWASYPKDMMVGKTRARAAKGEFGDVLGGLTLADDPDPILIQTAEVLEDDPRDPRDLDAATDALAQRSAPVPSVGTAERIRQEVERERVDPETGEVLDDPEREAEPEEASTLW
jgi:hypothetical protein